MRVCFDSRPAADPRGIGRYARCLLAGLRELAEGNGGEVVEGSEPRRGDDLFHAPWMNGALLRPRVPMVVTVHDLVSQKHAGLTLRAGLRGGMRKLAIERASRLICPTRAVADDVAALMRVARDRIEVIAEAPASAFRPRPAGEVAAACESHDVPEDYVLWVGDLRHPDPHRRIPSLVHAPRELPLVLVGAAGQWAHELDGAVVTGAVVGRRAGGALQRRPRARPALVRGGLRPAGHRGARVRHPGRRRRRARAPRGARRAGHVRRPRRRRGAHERRGGGAAARRPHRPSGRGPTPRPRPGASTSRRWRASGCGCA